MRSSVAAGFAGAACLVFTAGLIGCGIPYVAPVTYTPPVGNYNGAAFTGKVFAGSLPLAGASVQIYSAGTSGNGSAGTALLSSALTTDGNGAFSVAAGYTCPLATSVLYIVATGGHIAANSAGNTAIALMSSPGACSSIATNAGYTVNELTTVASAYAFAQFLNGPQLGATATNTSGLTLAAGTLANLINLTTGFGPGINFPVTGTAPIAKLNSLADALNACIVSSGSGSSACSSLFSFQASTTTGSSSTLGAVEGIVTNPGHIIGYAPYSLTTASTAFTPALTTAPADWTLFVNYTGGGMNDPSALSIDSKGNIWVTSYFSVASEFTNTGKPLYATGITGNGLGNIYGGTVDANDAMWIANEPGSANSVTVLSSAGTAAGGSPYTAGGLNFPIAIAVDATNVSWVVDYGNSHLTLLSNAGAPLSGSTGYNGVDAGGNGNFIFPVAVAVDGNRFGWLANQSSNTVTKVAADGSSFISYVVGAGPSGVAVDSTNNVWVANYYGDSIGLVSAAGAVLSGSGYTGGGVVHPQGIAADGAGNIWVANYRGPSLSEFAGVGSQSTVGHPLSPSAGWAPDAQLLEAFALSIDASGNIWITNFGTNILTEFVGLAAPVKTPLLGPTRIP